jgi:(E)-4-hydroxy-3-methylbut-2-enyl-diphosphate synthase
MNIVRRKARIIKIGDISIGGNNPIAIQSMAKTKTADVKETVREIKELEKCGCEIIRVAVKDVQDAKAIKLIKRQVNLPIVADIHFNWQLALEAMDSGADKIRLNPGNIYKKDEIARVISALKQAKIPLRIGVNSGSVKNLNSQNLTMADKLVNSAMDYIKVIEKMKFFDLVISLKGSGVLDTVEAYRKISKLCDYPLHLGVTATGPAYSGAIKSSIAIGALLLEGIGDTIRISLTDTPDKEIAAAKSILESLNLRHFGPQVVSCPTCGRCEVNLVKIVKELENKLSTIDYRLSTRPIKLAIMGCVVNGPGEAREADIGIAFGKNEGLLFRKGKPAKKVSLDKCVGTLLKEMEKINGKHNKR